jgi:ArsR family transcriptional regulator
MLNDDEICKVSEVFNAVGNPIRFKMLMLVMETERPLHIKAIARMLKMDYAAVYRHVKVLEKSGLLGIYEVGRSRVLYAKNTEMMRHMAELAKIILQKR